MNAARKYLGDYQQALCLCPPDRCTGCVRGDVNDSKPDTAAECAYDCPVAQALTRMGLTGIITEAQLSQPGNQWFPAR